jgi:hypothetical protein
MSPWDAFDPNVCCSRLDPERWNAGDLSWGGKLFLKDRVHSVFHVPINFGGVMKPDLELIDSKGALRRTRGSGRCLIGVRQ